MGFCDSDMKLIAISRDQNADEMLATFFHELKHAIAFEYNIPLNHPKIRRLEYDYRNIVMSFEWP